MSSSYITYMYAPFKYSLFNNDCYFSVLLITACVRQQVLDTTANGRGLTLDAEFTNKTL